MSEIYKPDKFNDFDDTNSLKKSRPKSIRKKIFHLLSVILLTIYIIFAWINHPEGIAPLAFVYFFTVLKIIFNYVPTSVVSRPVGALLQLAWTPVAKLPEKLRLALGAGILLALMVLTILLNPDSEQGNKTSRFRSLVGVAVIVSLLIATSTNRRAINPKILLMGIFLQFIIGLFIIRTQIGKELFTFISKGVASFLGLSKKGAAFIFTPDIIGTKMFATSVLPAIVFFAAFIQMVYWLGAMQWIIVKFAWLMVRLMDTSGSESVVAAASPFVGQGESALLVLPFLQYMTQSEIHSAMTSGFSTIAGSVLVAFEDFGVNTTYLITACIMSVPCSLALSKLRVPETEDSITKGQVSIPKEENREENILHAACNGAAQGMTLIALIVGSLLAIISLYHLANNILIWLCGFLNPASPITIELILGYVFYPFAWLIGVPLEDCRFVGQLMGTKMVVNEFVAYLNLADNYKNMTPRGITLATYGLCGFANIASVGIQIGCLGAMAPSRKADIAKLALSAMLTGTLCTFTSAAIAGIML